MSNYELLMVHYLMLKDQIRTLTYEKAFQKYLKKSDIVLDLGCGTGILSFLASKYCKKVYAVDRSNIIKYAQKTALKNDINNIEFINKDFFDLKLDEKVDYIVQEQIGHFIWDEDILKKIDYAKKNLLKKNGKILPDKIDLYLGLTSHKTQFEKNMNYWSSKPYNFDMSEFSKLAIQQSYNNLIIPQIDNIDQKDIKTMVNKIYHFDLNRDKAIPDILESEFFIEKKMIITGVAGYFTVIFDEDIIFSTDFNRTDNHWKHIFIPFNSPLKLNKGDKIKIIIKPDLDYKKWKIDYKKN